MDKSARSANPTPIVLGGIAVALAVAAGLWAVGGWVAASPVVIAAATIYGSWFATREAHRLDRDRRQEDAAEQRIAFLRALRTEITVTWDRYEEAVGHDVRDHPREHPYDLFFRANREYLHVYRTSAGRLGEIQDDDLRDAIERAYIYMTVLLEEHDRAHEGSMILNDRSKRSEIPPDMARERSAALAESVQAARCDAMQCVERAKARLNEAIGDSRS
jgi:hypothetical protein